MNKMDYDALGRTIECHKRRENLEGKREYVYLPLINYCQFSFYGCQVVLMAVVHL